MKFAIPLDPAMLYHRDTEKVILALMTDPTFEAVFQKLANDETTDVPRKVSDALYETDRILARLAETHFDAHPEEDEAPYVVYVVRNKETGLWDFVPAVGREQLYYVARSAYVSIISGTVGK